MGDDLGDYDFEDVELPRGKHSDDEDDDVGSGSKGRKKKGKKRPLKNKGETSDDHGSDDDSDDGAHTEPQASDEAVDGDGAAKSKKKKSNKKSKGVAGEEAANAIVGPAALSGTAPAAQDPALVAKAFMGLYAKELKEKALAAELAHGPQLLGGDIASSPASAELRSLAQQPVAAGSAIGGGNSGSGGGGGADAISDAYRKALPAFLKPFLLPPAPASAPAAVAAGRPRVVVLCSGALRCCALVPVLRDASKALGAANGGGKVLKLFAKHQKVPEQAAELRSTKAGVVVGTPNRLHRLLDDGALNLSDCRVLLLDSAHKDAKTFTLLSMHGARGLDCHTPLCHRTENDAICSLVRAHARSLSRPTCLFITPSVPVWLGAP